MIIYINGRGMNAPELKAYISELEALQRSVIFFPLGSYPHSPLLLRGTASQAPPVFRKDTAEGIRL